MPIDSRKGPVFIVTALALVMTDAALAAPGTPFALIRTLPKTLSPAVLAAAQKTETPAQVSAGKTSLIFHQKIVRLVAVTGPDNDMLSYQIDGLRNPALLVPRGATLQVLFVNTDDDMFHNIRFGPAPQTYPNVMTSYLKTSVGTPELPHHSGPLLHGMELTLRAPAVAGTYAYFCSVRGHAQGGMVGKVVVK